MDKGRLKMMKRKGAVDKERPKTDTGEPMEDMMRSGHLACPGCGIVIAMRLASRALGKKTVSVIIPSCSSIIAATYPHTSLKFPAFHGTFETAAPTAAGIAHALRLKGKSDISVVAFAGDGGTFDIGIQALSGCADRNENFIYICLDNEAYMNTGIQSSSATPNYAWTITTPSGRSGRKKNIMEIMAAHRIPYAATASIGYPQDLMDKVRKAKGIEGTRFIHILTPCATGWRMDENLSVRSAMLSVETRLFPLYEVFNGKQYAITYEPQGLPVAEYLGIQGRYRHLSAEQTAQIQSEVDEEWDSLIKRAAGC
jgi:pyruvate ferredoxin oxidoreductase beta subunit/2-oxoisovalerate ferredoxin oxidoreductase beta subunit